MEERASAEWQKEANDTAPFVMEIKPTVLVAEKKKERWTSNCEFIVSFCRLFLLSLQQKQ